MGRTQRTEGSSGGFFRERTVGWTGQGRGLGRQLARQLCANGTEPELTRPRWQLGSQGVREGQGGMEAWKGWDSAW